MHEVILCQTGTETKKKKPETKWKFGENAKHEKLTWTAFEFLMVLLKRGKLKEKRSHYLIYNVECYNIFGLAKGIVACEKLISHQLVQAVQIVKKRSVRFKLKYGLKKKKSLKIICFVC